MSVFFSAFSSVFSSFFSATLAFSLSINLLKKLPLGEVEAFSLGSFSFSISFATTGAATPAAPTAATSSVFEGSSVVVAGSVVAGAAVAGSVAATAGSVVVAGLTSSFFSVFLLGLKKVPKMLPRFPPFSLVGVVVSVLASAALGVSSAFFSSVARTEVARAALEGRNVL